ncbi:RING-type E3 ubiquitin-protein ligase PPIL2-like [Littorina saxatilis]|uniref:RING-type E3 ubiquitin-protein ligase PPIL2-like n=1 Tax=Littorina saxatilis TaxID=31220 RepID=UPI0038B4C9AC
MPCLVSTDMYHCPVTYKVFNENTHIVAVRQTGNVYCHDAVDRLNLKTGNLKDLMTDEPFTRKDIITIQDPTNLDKFNIQAFYYIRKKLKLTDEEEEKAKKDPRYHLKLVNNEAKSALEELDREYVPSPYLGSKEIFPQKADKFNAATYSCGRLLHIHSYLPSLIDEDVLRYERVLKMKKKGYVRMMTNKGPLNIELHCDMVPKTCENFIKLCAKGYYHGTVFHRSIRNFINSRRSALHNFSAHKHESARSPFEDLLFLATLHYNENWDRGDALDEEGNPTLSITFPKGKKGEYSVRKCKGPRAYGGESAWGDAFKDELKPNLTHAGRGVLSMANSGPNTNKSQFFFTYRSARQLDGKHAVFGRLVGGLETLDAMEKVEVDKKDKPKEEMKIESCVVFVNPYEEADELLGKEREDEKERERAEGEAAKRKKRDAKADTGPRVFKQGIGKYINSAAVKRVVDSGDKPDSSDSAKKRKVDGGSAYKLSDFSAW